MAVVKERILITGASGFTGVHAAGLAVQMNMDVTCISRRPHHKSSLRFTPCDIADYDQVERIVKETKPQYILHLAGFNNAELSWEAPLECLQNNILGTLNLLEAIRKHTPEAKILIIGSALQYSPCHNEKAPHPYSLSKTIQVLLSKEWKNFYSMNILLAKPSNLIGPGHSKGICSKVAKEIIMAESYKECVHIHLYNNKAQCDFVDVRDAVRAYLLILTTESTFNNFDIGSGKSRTLEDLIRNFRKVTNRSIQITKDYSIDSPKIKMDLKPIRSLGWQPQYTLRTSLTDILSYYKSKL